MKRTTIYLDPELEVLLKLEMRRQKRPVAELIREAIYAYLTRTPCTIPPGMGTFASGRSNTASRAEEMLVETGFGAVPSSRAKRRCT